MSMPSYIELVEAANVIITWFFWIIVYSIVTLMIGGLILTVVNEFRAKHKLIKPIYRKLANDTTREYKTVS